MGADTEIDPSKKIIFFDGVCNLCNGAVNFVIDRDMDCQFLFASLQSVYARNKLDEFAIASKDLDGIVLLKGKRALRKSNAVLEIARDLGGGWVLLYGLKLIPSVIRDWVYDFIARNRYRWFGKSDRCRVPSADILERFLGSEDVS